MKWGISPSREMPHFFVYFSTRTVMVCLRAYGVLTLYTKSNISKIVCKHTILNRVVC